MNDREIRTGSQAICQCGVFQNVLCLCTPQTLCYKPANQTLLLEVINVAVLQIKQLYFSDASQANRQLTRQTRVFYWELSDQPWSLPKCVHGFPKDLKFVPAQNRPLGIPAGITPNPPSACFLSPFCGILFLRINYCRLTLSLSHYFQMVLLFFFSPATQRCCGRNGAGISRVNSHPSMQPDFKHRKALPGFIQFVCLSPDRMILFPTRSLFQQFPVFL